MNRIFEILKKYMIFIAILTGISIVLGISYSNFIVTSGKHKAAEMYIGTLKYSMTIDGITTNTLSVPAGETIIDVTITNENPIDTYYKLIYQNNSNVSIKYYESTKDTNDKVTNYSSPNSKITSNNKNTIKLKIVNNSTSSQKVTFKITGGFATNTLNDVTVPSGYTTINTIETPSTNTYFCTTTDALTQGLKYVNGQYTYVYKQQLNENFDWENINSTGWGAVLTDSETTEAVTSKICSYINNKPLVSTSSMFYGAFAEVIDLSHFDTSNVTNMGGMFQHSQATTIDVSNFDTHNVTNMSNMFDNSQATILDLSSFDTSKVTNMSNMFFYSRATTIDVSNFDTSKVIDMSNMFEGSQAISLDLSSFNTSNVINMDGMFQDNEATTLNLSSFDTSKVTSMYSMFDGSQAATIDVSNFDTHNVTNMYGMFDNSQATTLDVSNFDTSNVTNMEYMFYNTKVTELDLSSFDTSKVTNISNMFRNASNLKTIYVSNKFNTDKVTSSTYMFNECTKLIGGAGTKYNSSYVDKTYARIDGGTSNPGYFTDVADKPKEPESFATDSWVTISNAVKNNNTGKYNVGDTKTIDMGTYGTHTLRIVNKSTPSECSTTGFSQTACGFVVEFADIVSKHNMNSSNTNVGGWPSTAMRTFTNNDIYNSLPSELQNIIINTIVVSSHGSSQTTNFTSTDKLYLLTPKEIFKNFDEYQYSSSDTSKDLTRTLDYYSNTTLTNRTSAVKNDTSGAATYWLRTANSGSTSGFWYVTSDGNISGTGASFPDNLAPAFRIG